MFDGQLYPPYLKSLLSPVMSYKCRKWGGLGWLGVTQGHHQCHLSIEHIYDFLFIFNRNYAPVLYRFRDTLSYLLKFANFSLPHLHLASPAEGDCVRISKRFLASENESLSWGVICIILHLVVLVEHQLVTDTQTDTWSGHIPRRAIPRAMLCAVTKR